MKLPIFLAILLLPVTVLASIPAFPMAFWGTASIDGVFAPAGAIVRVYDGSIEVGKATVQNNGVYGYTEPTKQKLVVGEAGGVLTFTIQDLSVNGGVETQGLTVITHSSFVSGETVNKNLSFTTKTTVVNPPSSGGSSGGGGGGVGKPKVKAPTNELVLGVSTSTVSSTLPLSIEEQNIALKKQIIILLTQLLSLLQLQMKLSL